MAVSVLVVDIGGNNVKMRVSGAESKRKFPSGPLLTPQSMAEQVREMTADWQYECVTIGYPGPVANNRVTKEPHNLAPGWITFDFEAAFEKPLKLVNDAAMQALGSYQGDKMLFMGLGTGLGATMVANNVILPLEVAHMPFRDGMTYEDFVGKRGLERLGKRSWRDAVVEVAGILRHALIADYIVFGGGNAKKIKDLPDWCVIGSNENAFDGGEKMWTNQELRLL